MHDVRDMERMAEAHRELTAKMLADAAQFNKEIVGYPIPAEPQLMSDDRADFRADFMQEELDEFRKAQKAGDLDGAVDAIIDLMYVAAGAMNEMGVATQPCWDEVHRANMRKKRGAQSKRPGGQGFDAVKPEGWQAPSHAEYLTITSADVAALLQGRRIFADMESRRKAALAGAPDDIEAAIGSGGAGGRGGGGPEAKVVLVDTQAGVGIKANDDFKYVGDKFAGKWESSLVGKTGFVFSVDEAKGQAEVKFYDSVLPQRMVLSLREIVKAPKSRKSVASTAKTLPRVLVMGYARHGKDTVADLMASKYGFRFTSSSAFCAERVVFPWFQQVYADQQNGQLPVDPAIPVYTSAQECFEDRHNKRSLWYDLITQFNTPDLTALGRAIYEGHDLYCGIRNAREFHALRNARVFDVSIWVDAFERSGSIEDRSSCTVEPWMADYVLDNNGSLADLERNLAALMQDRVL